VLRFLDDVRGVALDCTGCFDGHDGSLLLVK
jgi:hypothetical protein